jgi:hypothetical protein
LLKSIVLLGKPIQAQALLGTEPKPKAKIII